jgi:ubiquinone/menaquinone biosynthesis C-methylase UbiE
MALADRIPFLRHLWKVKVHREQHFSKLYGRRYLMDIACLMPKDDLEYQRLFFQHHFLYQAMGSNVAARIEIPHQVLDIGCGTGQWVIEIAQQFAQARVVGIDVVMPPLRVGAAEYPSNVLFKQYDVLEGIPFAKDTFDYTHMRYMASSIPEVHWGTIVNEMLRVTRPGGWIEWIESGPIENAPPSIQIFWDAWGKLGQLRGMNPYPGNRISQFFVRDDVAPVINRTLKIPIGNSQGRLGVMSGLDIIALFSALRPLILYHGILNASEFDAAFARAKEELVHADSHCIWTITIVCGQRTR